MPGLCRFRTRVRRPAHRQRGQLWHQAVLPEWRRRMLGRARGLRRQRWHHGRRHRVGDPQLGRRRRRHRCVPGACRPPDTRGDRPQPGALGQRCRRRCRLRHHQPRSDLQRAGQRGAHGWWPAQRRAQRDLPQPAHGPRCAGQRHRRRQRGLAHRSTRPHRDARADGALPTARAHRHLWRRSRRHSRQPHRAHRQCRRWRAQRQRELHRRHRLPQAAPAAGSRDPRRLGLGHQRCRARAAGRRQRAFDRPRHGRIALPPAGGGRPWTWLRVHRTS